MELGERPKLSLLHGKRHFFCEHFESSRDPFASLGTLSICPHFSPCKTGLSPYFGS
jgi:hypothetical protein